MQTRVPMECEESLPFDDDNYSFEVKFDGERSLLFFEKGNLFIQNKNGVDVTYRYPELQSLADGKEAVVDGEIVIFDENGKSDFELLAQRSHLQKKFDIELRMKKLPVVFMSFDVLSFANEDITKLPLTRRREILFQEFTPRPNLFHWSLAYKGFNGKALFEQAKMLNLEGIIGKHIDSPYLEGRHSPYWKKVKNTKTVDMVFTKYTVNNAGIRVENERGIAVQVSGRNALVAKREIDEKGKVLIVVKYLNLTKNGKLRMPTCKEVVV